MAMTRYVNVNLYRDIITGRVVTGILSFLNKTPIDWFLMKQSTSETLAYGSEFVAAQTYVEQIIDLRTTRINLGVIIIESSYMFGDNDSIVLISMNFIIKLHKRHSELSFHQVREYFTYGICRFHYLPGELNLADVLSKYWLYSDTWKLLDPLNFWYGNTVDIPID